MYSVILKGETWHGELKNKAKDGSLHWVSTTIVPRRDANRDIVQYLSIRTDITKRKKAEKELDLFLNTAAIFVAIFRQMATFGL